MRGKTGLQGKLLFVTIPTITAIYMLLAAATNHFFSQELVNRKKLDVMTETAEVSDRISDLLASASVCAEYVSFDLLTAESGVGLPDSGMGAVEQNAMTKKLQRRLYQYAVIFPQLESICVISADNKLFLSNYLVSFGRNPTVAGSITEQLNAARGDSVWFPYEMREYLVTDPARLSYLYGQSIPGAEDMDMPRGYVLISLQEERVHALYANLEERGIKEYLLVAGDGQIISGTDKALLLSRQYQPAIGGLLALSEPRQDELSLDGKTHLVTAVPVAGTPLTLLNLYDFGAVTGRTSRQNFLLMGTFLLILLVSIVVIVVFSRRITGHLSGFGDQMERVRRGDFTGRLRLRTGDEFEFFADRYNDMVQNIDDLFRQIRIAEDKELRTRLDLFQGKIQPGFLYGCLERIRTLIEAGDTEQAMTSVKALADYYRTALSDGEEIISVAAELRNLENYVTLQSICFDSGCDLDVTLSPGLLRYCIPKLTLSAVAESLIRLAGDAGEQASRLGVTGCTQREELLLVMTCIGLSAGSAIAALLREEMAVGSLHNTARRLRLYFGANSRMEAEAVAEGVAVTIHLEGPKDEQTERG